MIEISYGPSPLTLDNSIMTLCDVETGLRVSFIVSADAIDRGAVAFDALLFAPAMDTLTKSVARRKFLDA